MRKFIKHILPFIFILLAYNFATSAYGLYMLNSKYKYPKKDAIKLLENERKTKKCLVVGSSNLQFNIDKDEVRKKFPEVDFLMFSGSEGPSILHFFKTQGLFLAYEKIIFYMPYHLYEKNTKIDQNAYHFRDLGSFYYAVNVIKNDPLNVLIDWKSYYDSIAVYRKSASNESSYFASNDHLVDSIVKYNSLYNNCNHPFNRKKHIVFLPKLTLLDQLHFEKITSKDYHILFTPIPNLPENVANIAQAGESFSLLKNSINTPFTMDSALFYDQWYHLNRCGRTIETKRFIKILSAIYP